MAKKLTSDQTLTAILSYLGILFIIPLLVVKKRDNFIRFHLSQGINLFILMLIAWVALFILGLIPLLGMLVQVIGSLIGIGFMILIILAIVKGLQGEEWVLPVVGSYNFVNLK